MRKSILSAFFALFASSVLAQGIDIPSVQSNINSKITSNNTGAITGALLNSTLQNMVLSYSSKTVNNQFGTTYVFADSDRYKLVTLNNASPIAVTLPQANVPPTQFVLGWQTTVYNAGAGTVTITPTISTINGLGSLTLTTGQSVTLISDGSNYTSVGNLIVPNSITNVLLAQMPALSVKANGTNATANASDLAGTANQALRVDNAGVTLGFGAINLTSGSAVSGALSLGNGGTGATTAPLARVAAALNIDQITTQGDAPYTILSTDRVVATSAAFTASRTWTLPAANSVNPGQTLTILDAAGGVSGANTLVIARAGADTINGATSTTLSSARAGVLLTSDGVSKWTFVVSPGSGTVTNVATTAPITGGPITGTGTLGLNATIYPQGRLTLQSANPVMVSTQSAKTTLFYTPYNGNLIPLYDGTNMVPVAFSEISVPTTDTTKNPAAIGASKVNDWFIWNDSGALRLTHCADWTNDTTKSANCALTIVNGVPLNNASITNGPAAQRGTWVGTTRSNGSSQLDWIYGAAASGGTAAFFGVWNNYNRVEIGTDVVDNGASYTYSSATIRQARASAGNQVTWVSGAQEDSIGIATSCRIATPAAAGANAACGPDIDSTTTTSTVRGTIIAVNGNITDISFFPGKMFFPAPGVHVISRNELSDGTNTSTFNGGSRDTLSARLRM